MGNIYSFIYKIGKESCSYSRNRKQKIPYMLCHCNNFFHWFTALMLFGSLVNKQHQFTGLPLKKTNR